MVLEASPWAVACLSRSLAALGMAGGAVRSEEWGVRSDPPSTSYSAELRHDPRSSDT